MERLRKVTKSVVELVSHILRCEISLERLGVMRCIPQAPEVQDQINSRMPQVRKSSSVVGHRTGDVVEVVPFQSRVSRQGFIQVAKVVGVVDDDTMVLPVEPAIYARDRLEQRVVLESLR